MRKELEPVFLSICALLVCWATYYCFNWLNTPWFTTYWGLVGTNLGIVAFIYTLYQINQLRSESKVIQETTSLTKNRLVSFNLYGELAKGVKLIQEVQGYIRAKKYETGVLRLQELKLVIGIARAQNAKRAAPLDLDAALQTINQLINGMEKEMIVSSPSFQVPTANASLEVVLDVIHVLQQDTLEES